ncbi:hypothetical protein OKW36_005429 [Paraburkholderia sp. MM5482-R1]
MSNLPKRIRAIFDNNPKLYELIPRPVLISENSLGSALNVALSHGARGGRQRRRFLPDRVQEGLVSRVDGDQ